DRERTLLEPALVALESAGVPRERLVAVTRFRTQRIGRAVEDALAVIDESPLPGLTIDRVLSTATELDDLLGQPLLHLPGTDTAGPDGLADLDPVGGVAAVFSFGGSPPFQPVQVRDAFRQLCLDVDQAARTLASADLAPLRQALADAGVGGLEALSFDEGTI